MVKRKLKSKPKTPPVNNLVIVSDLHCGCQAGLCPSSGAERDEGGRYQSSSLQKKVWGWWEEFWGEWVPQACHGEPFAVAVNGDAIDGRHHGATHQIDQNLAMQVKLAEEILKPVVDLCEGRFYMIRGTESHVGPSAENEETLAKSLGAIKDMHGSYCRRELRIRIGGKARAHLLHHIGTTGTTAYEATAIFKELAESYVEAGRWGQHPYDAVVRSHRHRMCMITCPSVNGYAFSMTTPGWQLKTPFTYRIPGGRMSQPQFGGSLLRQGDEEFHTRHFVRSIDPPKEEVL